MADDLGDWWKSDDTIFPWAIPLENIELVDRPGASAGEAAAAMWSELETKKRVELGCEVRFVGPGVLGFDEAFARLVVVSGVVVEDAARGRIRRAGRLEEVRFLVIVGVRVKHRFVAADPVVRRELEVLFGEGTVAPLRTSTG